jgi:hypothetical protein
MDSDADSDSMWYEYATDDRKRKYFFNILTEETTWVKPHGVRINKDPSRPSAPPRPDPVDSAEAKDARLRKNIVDEILDSEKAYLENLASLLEHYIKPLQTNGRVDFPDLYANPKGDITVSFSFLCMFAFPRLSFVLLGLRCVRLLSHTSR